VWWDETHPDAEIPPSTAVFAPITGNTGFLVGPAVAGVFWETATQQGVTGLDGRFQYEKGETVRFMIGDTLLGEVTGQAQVTPFDLADSAVITGTANITEALANDRDPFQAVINTTIFLQSLDHDANPENGIEIKSGVAALFQRVSLDMSEQWQTFAKEFDLRHAIGQANSKHRFSVVHGLANPAPALQRLYQTLGIDAQTFAVSREQITSEDFPEYIESSNYDTSGNLTRFEWDVPLSDPDSFFQGSISIYEYDAHGNLIRKKGDDDSDHTVRYEYDALGNLTLHEEDPDGDGDGKPEYIERWQYNADGNAILLEVEEDYTDGVVIAGNDGPGYEGGELFSNGVALPESEVNDIAFITYVDGPGQQPPNGNARDQGQIFGTGGTVDATTDTLSQSITAGISGYLTGIQIQFNAEIPAPAPVLKFSIYAGGNPPTGDALYSEELDLESIAYDRLFTWDLTDASLFFEAGQRFTFTLRTLGEFSTSRIESYSYEYDAHGNQTQMEWDEDGDGKPELIESWQYQYGLDGKLTRAEYDAVTDFDDGTLDEVSSVTTYQYDVEGKLIRVELNGDGLRGAAESLGIPDIQYLEYAETYSVNYEYDADGNLARDVRDGFNSDRGRHIVSRQYDAKGYVTRYEGRLELYGDSPIPEETTISKFEYDDYGNIVREITDEGGDGTPDYIATYEYDAHGNKTRHEVDEDGDGIPDTIVAYEYDADGNLTRREEKDDEGIFTIVSWQYDANGNATRQARDQYGDGTLDEIVTYEYEATGWGHIFAPDPPQNGVKSVFYPWLD
jgi:YD repeat-containing protein